MIYGTVGRYNVLGAAQLSEGETGVNACQVTISLIRKQHKALKHLAKTEIIKVAWLTRRRVALLVQQGGRELAPAFGEQP